MANADAEKNFREQLFQLEIPDTDSPQEYGEPVNNAAVPATAVAGKRTTPRHLKEKPKKTRKFFSILFQIIGEILITLGILLGLFILWTIWWTNVTSEVALEQEVVQLQEEFGGPPPMIAAPAQTGEPPAVAPVAEGETLGIMRIPAFGIDNQTAIKEGTRKDILDQGVFSHYKETALPGEIGNFATAAHRDIYGARLRDVDKLKEGMPVIVETKDAFLIYKIIGQDLVYPEDIYTIAPDPFKSKETWKAKRQISNKAPTRRLLTLTTCHPIFVATERYIIYAEFEYWTKRADGLPKELIAENATAAPLPAHITPTAFPNVLSATQNFALAGNRKLQVHTAAPLATATQF